MKIIAINIHPKWLIEEKAIILRKDVWLSPPIAPIRVAIMVKIINVLFIFRKYIKITIGPIFCQVINIIALFHLQFSITFGNQKWNGGAPSFIIIDNKISLIGIL